jgi:UDP-N-acetyl-D-galactosamine dehydrogenase
VLILGLTFKENCPDLRNTRVVDIVQEFRDYNAHVDVYDPWVDPREAVHEYGVEPIPEPKPGHYDAIILAVAHQQFREMGVARIRALGKPGSVLFDVKYLLPATAVDGRL